MELIDVKLDHSKETIQCRTSGKITNLGDLCVIKTETTQEVGTVLSEIRIIDDKRAENSIPQMIRIASKADLHRLDVNRDLEEKAVKICLEKIVKHKLTMKLVSARYYFDQSKIIFFFTAENRVDFRSLVKDLATTLKTRIELRQIGVREEAKIIGGYGTCGLELCCKRNICQLGQRGNKEIVSIKMAKAQDLSLSSSKITGVCGRLMCCISYEYEFYRDEVKKYPRSGAKVSYNNQRCTVVSINVVSKQLLLRSEDHSYFLVEKDDLDRGEGPADTGKTQPGSGREGRDRDTKERAAAPAAKDDRKRRDNRKRRDRQKPTTPDTAAQTSETSAARGDTSRGNKESKSAKRRRRRRKKNRPQNKNNKNGTSADS